MESVGDSEFELFFNIVVTTSTVKHVVYKEDELDPVSVGAMLSEDAEVSLDWWKLCACSQAAKPQICHSIIYH
jgi:hypothetical protein